MTKLLKKTACTLLALLLLTGLVPAAQAEESSQEVQQMPALTGMFVATELVTHDNPWTQEDWNHAVRQLKDAGMDKIVLQYAVQYYSESYKVYYYTPSFEDPGENVNNRQQTIEYALNACRDNGVQLWLGLHLAEDMWFSSMNAGFRDIGEDGKSEFLTTSAEFSKKVFDDLWAQYGAEYGDVIGGWYLPYEFNNTVGETARTRLVQDFYAPLTEHMKQVTPDKQIMVSPLIYPPMLTEPTQEMLNTWEMLCYDVWANSRVDIIAPQDGCGWESSVRENLPPYYEAMVRAKEAAQTERDRKGWGRAVAWNNPELYSMTGSNTMTMQRFGANMQTLDQYVEEHVSFSLHSLVYFDDLTKAGTNPTNRAFYEAYLRMVQQGGLTQPEQPIPAPSGLSAAVENEFDAALSWERLELEDPALPVAGYQIRREDVNDPEAGAILLRDVPQPAEGEQTVTTVDAQLEPGHTYRYSVYAYDGAGNLSGQPAVTEVTIDSTAVALKTVSAKQTVSPLAVSAYGLDNAPLVSGDLSALTAGGMEVVPSLYNFLVSLRDAGYNVEGLPSSAEALGELIARQGAVFGSYAQGTSSRFMDEGDPQWIDAESYASWVEQALPEELYESVTASGGDFPGPYMSRNGKLALARIRLGNVLLMPQPAAGGGDNDFQMVHGTHAAPPHNYIAAYLYARYGFGADALVHFGTHGSLEFTPSKQVALSRFDWPDRLVGTLPHFYLYTIGNVGEGVIAKRRAYAGLQSYLTAPFTESGVLKMSFRNIRKPSNQGVKSMRCR